MAEHDWLAERFEGHRIHLRAVAFRMLGSMSEAEDAVQESWLHLSRSDPSSVENLGGWLTTVVARVCLDMLRARKARREEPLDAHVPEQVVSRQEGSNPAQEALLVDSVGLALLVVLETLAPAERLAFVLHDLFAVPFDEIAPIVGRSPAAARQLASRARRRVQGAAIVADSDHQPGATEHHKVVRATGIPTAGWRHFDHQREVVAAFLAAARGGDFATLLALLDPEVVLRADDAAVQTGATPEVRGATDVAGTFAGRARFAQPALVDNAVGAVWAPGGQPRIIFGFTITSGKIAMIEIIADPDRLSHCELVLLDT